MKPLHAQAVRTAINVSRVVLLLVVLGIVLISLFPYSNSFSTLPTRTKSRSGAVGDPVNLIFIGSQEQLTTSFEQAGWLLPDPITAHSTEQIILASIAHRSYPTAPVSNLYLYGRAQDLAFEKPTSDVAIRDHIRLWQTDMRSHGEPLWEGQASYDHGIELSASTHFPTHHIAPAVDAERDTVGADLQRTGLVHSESYVGFTTPTVVGHNAGGDFYASDGAVLVLNLTTSPLPSEATATGAPDLRRAAFGVYDTVLTTQALALAISAIGLALVFLALWPELHWLFQRSKRCRAPQGGNAG